MALTTLETKDMMADPSTVHQNPCMAMPTPNTATASHDARFINSTLMINAISPKLKIEKGRAITCTTGLIEALIKAMKSAKAPTASALLSPTGSMAVSGSSQTMTPAAMVRVIQREMKLLMVSLWQEPVS